MSEGPQARRKADWLNRTLGGRRVSLCKSARADLARLAETVQGMRIDTVFSRGKHLFFALSDGSYLHSHLLMRGAWRYLAGGCDTAPKNAWLVLGLGGHDSPAVCNIDGQVLDLLTQEEMERVVRSLGPDIMDLPLPEKALSDSLRACSLPIAEALLDQSVIAGIGNICKSEGLFAAGVAPQVRASDLDETALSRLVHVLAELCWASYRDGGRWRPKVYRKSGSPCPSCSNPIERLRLSPSRRLTYYCPVCQPTGGANRQLLLFSPPE